ncbi:MAG: Gamma-D-glutamyl-L-lysine endopeptidase [Chlamydiae bacterium]|nr:Gamma-D-glutamyl-L-lysine endopeptidase [Chlamydiota bacterium]
MKCLIKTAIADLWREREKGRETQLLRGEKVEVIEKAGEWLYVSALEQERFTEEKEWHPYPGWLHRNAVEFMESFSPSHSSQAPLNLRQLISDAESFLNIPYLWGGRSREGVDCSGLINLIFRAQGFSIPRDAHDQYLRSQKITREQLQLGDLIFFTPREKLERITHVVLYKEKGWSIEAPETGKVVSYLPKTVLDEREKKYQLSYGRFSTL